VLKFILIKNGKEDRIKLYIIINLMEIKYLSYLMILMVRNWIQVNGIIKEVLMDTIIFKILLYL